VCLLGWEHGVIRLVRGPEPKTRSQAVVVDPATTHSTASPPQFNSIGGALRPGTLVKRGHHRAAHLAVAGRAQ
jgi:hypothetical protein